MVSKSLTMGKSEHVSKQKTIQMQLCDIISTSITMEGKEWQKRVTTTPFHFWHSTVLQQVEYYMSMTKCMTVLSSAKDEFLISTNFSQDPLSTSSFSFSVSFENLLCDSKDTFKLTSQAKNEFWYFFFATSSSSTFVKCYAEWNHAYHISIGMNILFYYLDEIKIDEVQTLSRRSNCKRWRNLSSATATGSFEDARDLQNVKCAKLMCFGLARILIQLCELIRNLRLLSHVELISLSENRASREPSYIY